MLMLGDCLERLKDLPDNSIDSVITDPPYGLSFMNKKWDYDVPSVDVWREVLRVLKPGGHVLSFGGTRTYHRMVVSIEDAGFEIRDQLQWLYGSGFPKSHDVSKGIDKASGVEREKITRIRLGDDNPSVTTQKGWKNSSDNDLQSDPNPITDAAKKWQGWGTALKPANEPIVLARKPLSEKTVALNVQRWGTGALNIDASRIATEENLNGGTYSGDKRPSSRDSWGNGVGGGVLKNGIGKEYVQPQGRWPANLILDEESARLLDEQSASNMHGAGKANTLKGNKTKGNIFQNSNDVTRFGDSGGASRFFYVAKASKRERNAGLEGMPEKDRPLAISQWEGQTNGSGEVMGPSKPQQNFHPTVKPIKLMEYLITLVTPPMGIVLDPFMGSGSTGVAAHRLGFGFIGIEMSPEYLEIARRRIEHARGVAA